MTYLEIKSSSSADFQHHTNLQNFPENFSYFSRSYQSKICPHESRELKFVLPIVFTIRKIDDYEYDASISLLIGFPFFLILIGFTNSIGKS